MLLITRTYVTSNPLVSGSPIAVYLILHNTNVKTQRCPLPIAFNPLCQSDPS